MICFCCPSVGDRKTESVRRLLRDAEGAGHPVVTNSVSPHDRARGMLAAQALETGAEWMLWVDDDQEAEFSQAIELVTTGELVGADLCTGIYVCRHEASQGRLATNISPLIGGEYMFGAGGGPYPIAACGFGFVAVRREVFEVVDAPACEYGKAWFLPLVEGGLHLGEDRSFCVRAGRAGCQMYADTRVLVGHVGTKTWRMEDFGR